MSIPEQGAESPDLAELASARERVLQDYLELREQLRDESRSADAVHLLRQVSSHRATLARLDEELKRRRSSVRAVEEDEPVDRAPTMIVPFDHPEPEQPVESDPPARPQPQPQPAPDPVAAERAPEDEGAPLVLRFLLEGPVGSDASTVATQLSEQFRAHRQRATAAGGEVAVELLDFDAGMFEGQAITFQVIHLSGGADRELRRFARSLVDLIVVVVDALPDGRSRSAGYVSELLDDRDSLSEDHRPEITVFANRSDLADAFDADQVASELLVESSVHVVATSREQGFLYGFVLATNTAVRRAQRRQAVGLPWHRTLGIDELQRFLDDAAEAGFGPPPGRRPASSNDTTQSNETTPVAASPTPRPAPPRRPVPGGLIPFYRPAPASPDRPPSERASPQPQPPQPLTPQSGIGERKRRARGLRRLISALRNPDHDDR